MGQGEPFKIEYTASGCAHGGQHRDLPYLLWSGPGDDSAVDSVVFRADALAA